jgi:hypothetical protein
VGGGEGAEGARADGGLPARSADYPIPAGGVRVSYEAAKRMWSLTVTVAGMILASAYAYGVWVWATGGGAF